MTVYLVRHGSAGHRNDGEPGDIDRPLDPAGVEQATNIAEDLRGGPIVRVLSSPATRCVETVSGLAATMGLELELHDSLYEGTPIEMSWALLEWAATVNGDVVLCSHGDVIPELISRAQLRGMDIPGKSGCAKGSIWELRHDGDRFTSGRYRKTASG